MRGKGIVALLGGALLMAGAATSVRADLLTQKCEAAKYKCVTGLSSGLIGCYAKDSTKPLAVPDALSPCLAKVKTKFDAAVTGCIAKAESKPPCVSTDDPVDFENSHTPFIDQMAANVDAQNSHCTAAGVPFSCCTGDHVGTCTFPPAQVLSKCNAGKKKCLAGKLKGLLGCYAKSAGKPEPANSECNAAGAPYSCCTGLGTGTCPGHPLLDACIAKVKGKFDGGAFPEKGCFRKLQDKLPSNAACTALGTPYSCCTGAGTGTCLGDCSTGVVMDDTETDTLEALVDSYVDNIHPILSCGNGRVETGEFCDDDNRTTGDGCDHACRREVCGDGIISDVENCDDGNTNDDDQCPADCFIDPCTPNAGSHQQATVSFAGVNIAGITVLVDYPEGSVTIPGSGAAAAPRISGLPSGTSGVTNDLDHKLREVVQDGTPFATFAPGQLFKIDFQTCQGAPPVTTADFAGKCTVVSAANGSGGDVTGSVTCSVTVP